MAINARYGVTIEGGTSAWKIDGFFSEGVLVGSIDVHGGDSYDGVAKNITAPGQPVTVGNLSWRRGASLLTYSGVNCDELRVITAIRDSTMDAFFVNRIRIETSQDDPNDGSPPAVPAVVTFSGCNVDCNSTDNGAAIRFYADTGQQLYFSEVAFQGCAVKQNLTSARALIINNPWAQSLVTFEDCTFECTGTNAMFQLGSSGIDADLSCYVLNSQFVAPTSAKVAAGGSNTYSVFVNSTSGGLTPNYRGTAFPATTPLTSTMVDANINWQED